MSVSRLFQSHSSGSSLGARAVLLKERPSGLGRLRTALVKDERGLSTVEYVIILVLIAAVCVATWGAFGKKVKAWLGEGTDTINTELEGAGGAAGGGADEPGSGGGAAAGGGAAGGNGAAGGGAAGGNGAARTGPRTK